MATVKDAPLGAPTGLTIGMVPNQPVNGVIGGFADADLFATPANYQINVDWGDGQTSPGTAAAVSICCAGNVSNFNIIGNHTYSTAGTYTVTSTVTDILGGPQPVPNNVVARSVIYAPVIEVFPSQATEGAFFQTTLARIPMVDVHIGYQKIIDWGDGTIEGPTPVAQACVTNPNGSTDCFWLAGGGHTYQEEGTSGRPPTTLAARLSSAAARPNCAPTRSPTWQAIRRCWSSRSAQGTPATRASERG